MMFASSYRCSSIRRDAVQSLVMATDAARNVARTGFAPLLALLSWPRLEIGTRYAVRVGMAAND